MHDIMHKRHAPNSTSRPDADKAVSSVLPCPCAEQGAQAGLPVFLQRAGLTVSAPDDPYEREAQAFAASMTNTPAGHRRGDAAPTARRPLPRLPIYQSAGTLQPPDGGQSIAAPLRAEFEGSLGVDLGHVRVHNSPPAQAAAHSLHAEAFTNQNHIWLGPQQSPSDSNLLAHELAHVLLGHQGIQRQVAGSQTGSQPASPAQNLSGLTNSDFIGALADVRNWLTSHGPADPGYQEHIAQRDRIETERRRRVSLGHIWITPDINGSPAQLYQLVQRNGNVTAVVRAEPERVNGVPEDLGSNPIMTPEQFQARLALENAQTALASQLMAQLALSQGFGAAQPTVGVPQAEGGRVPRPFSIVDPATTPQFSNLPVPATHVEGWGTMPVATPLPGYGPAGGDQWPRMTMGQFSNVRSRSTRFLVAFDGPNPVVIGMDQFTPSTASQSTGAMATHGYVVSMVGSGGVGRVMLGERMLRALRMGQTQHQLQVNPNSGPRAGSSAGPEVNAVERFHADIFRAAGRSGAPSAGQYYTLNAEEMARVALDFGVNMLPAEAAALRRVAAGDRAALADLQALIPQAQAAARAQLQQASFEGRLPGAAQGTFSERTQFAFSRALISPYSAEYAAMQRFGMPRATGQGGAMGAGMGALLALPVDAAVTYATGGSFENYGDRVPRVLSTGAFAGGVAGASEQYLASRASSSLIARGLGPGLGTTSSMLGARLIPGGIGAAGAELLNIYVFEADRPHSDREALLRTGRAGGIGVVSTAAGLGAQAATTSVIAAIMASGGTGAASGSVVPGWGTAIGFVVGLGVGVTVYVILDSNLPTVDRTQ